MRNNGRTLLLSAIATAACFAVLGCGGSSSEPTRSIPVAGVPSKPVDLVPKVETPVSSSPKDVSLTSEIFIRLGLPADDRIWTSKDMGEAVNVFLEIERKEGWPLPRYKSARSGKMFDRLTSVQNLLLYSDRNLSLDVRIPQLLAYSKACNQVFKIYINALTKKSIGNDELIELFGHQLRTHVVITELFDEFLPTIRKDDPDYEIRMKGVEQGKMGLAGLVSGSLESLEERGAPKHAELSRLLEYMIETFPKIVPALPSGAKNEIMLRLDKLIQDPAKKGFNPGLLELKTKLGATVQK